jgi:hypothetical protein
VEELQGGEIQELEETLVPLSLLVEDLVGLLQVVMALPVAEVVDQVQLVVMVEPIVLEVMEGMVLITQSQV